MQVVIKTYRDAVEHLLDYAGAATDPQTERKARRAVQLAVSAYWSKRHWNYAYKRGRITTVLPYSTGTITYLATSGTVPRQLTLSGGTWPLWAGDGQLGLGQIPYNVSSRISGTVLQLASGTAPPSDITTPTPYVLAQPNYTMPADFGQAGEVVNMGFARAMLYQPPMEFIAQQRVYIGPANPYMYTFMADPNRYGALTIGFYPPPDQVYEMDFIYGKQGRPLNILGYSAGKINTTTGLTTVTGNGTVFTNQMVGSVIRIAQNPTDGIPTGPDGASPFFLQRTVTGWISATQITIDQDPQNTLANVPYIISDPVDIEVASMSNYWYRELEKQFRIVQRMEATKAETGEYDRSLMEAFEADSRHYESRSTFSSQISAVRIATMPRGADMGT